MGFMIPLDRWRRARLKRQLRELDRQIRQAALDKISERTVRQTARLVKRARRISKRSKKIDCRLGRKTKAGC